MTTNKEFKQKLKVDEYVFEIEGKDIYDAYLIYSINNIESNIYKDGKKEGYINNTILCIELNGKDKDGNDAWISFDLKFDINYLNTLSNIPIDITNTLRGSESFIKKPNNELSGFLDFELPKNDKYDIYRNLSSLWVSKIDVNKFVFKLVIPNLLFTFFTIKID